MVRFQSIEESLGKIKVLCQKLDKIHVYSVCGLIFMTPAAYMAGKISFISANQLPVLLESCSMTFQATSTPATPVSTVKSSSKGAYVASKSSKKFHSSKCPSARLIKEGNRIYFSSREEAVAAGFSPAGNCDM